MMFELQYAADQNVIRNMLAPSDPKRTYLGFALAIAYICRSHNASVTSWWRSATRNASVGGKTKSYHLSGLAADVIPDDPNDSGAITYMAEQLGLQAIHEGNHIHIEADAEHLRRAAATW